MEILVDNKAIAMGERGKIVAVFGLTLLAFAGLAVRNHAYAANYAIPLDCTGSPIPLTIVNDGDTVSFYSTSTTSDIPTTVSISDGDTVTVGVGASTPLSSTNSPLNFSD